MARSRALILFRLAAALLLWGAAAGADNAFAASCCGGGSASSLTLSKFASSMIDVSLDVEKYDGYWDSEGKYKSDPPGSRLSQYRLNLGYARRLSPNWQVSAALPFVWNDNRYSAVSSSTKGIGDAAFGFWYEAFDEMRCVWKVESIEDMKPAIYAGATITAPTGISPYDGVSTSFDVTGRGFWRVDANLLLDKTVYPWNATLMYSYGVYMERPVNREYGNYVQPYHKKLGDRRLVSLSGGYTYFMHNMSSLTGTLALSELSEAGGTIDGAADPTTGMRKRSVAGTIAWASDDRDWVTKFTISHTIKQDGYGANFPATDVFTLGVSHVLR